MQTSLLIYLAYNFVVKNCKRKKLHSLEGDVSDGDGGKLIKKC